jgi:hypothetical protein
MARDHKIIHAAGPDRESIASGGYVLPLPSTSHLPYRRYAEHNIGVSWWRCGIGFSSIDDNDAMWGGNFHRNRFQAAKPLPEVDFYWAGPASLQNDRVG